MKLLSLDTEPGVEEIVIEGYRKMPVWRKFHCIAEMISSLRQMQLAEIGERHPQADEQELKMRLASRWIEPELMKKAFGWDVEKEGY